MELTDAIFTSHAMSQAERRGILEADIRAVLDHPEATREVRPGRIVVHGMRGEHLLRVFVDVDRTPPEIVTAYRTSQIEKYRKLP